MIFNELPSLYDCLHIDVVVAEYRIYGYFSCCVSNAVKDSSNLFRDEIIIIIISFKLNL